MTVAAAVCVACSTNDSSTAPSLAQTSSAAASPTPAPTPAPSNPTPATITFDGLSGRSGCVGANPAAGCAVTSYTEAGMTVTAVSATWMAITSYGHPAPFLEFITPANAAATGEILVSSANGPFTFVSVELYSSISTIPYAITGTRNGTTVLSLSATVPNTFGKFQVVSAPALTLIDGLSIKLTNPAVCCPNPVGLDNIAVLR